MSIEQRSGWRWVVAIVGSFAVTAAVGYAAFTGIPRVQTVEHRVTKPVYETKTVDVPRVVLKADGTVEQTSTTLTYREGKVIPEAGSLSVLPSSLETLRFWGLVCVAVFCGVYAFGILGMWLRDRYQRSTTKHSDIVDRHLQRVLTFAFGTLTGLLAGTNMSAPPIEHKQLAEDNRTIKQYKHLLDDAYEDLHSIANAASEGKIAVTPPKTKQPDASIPTPADSPQSKRKPAGTNKGKE